MIYELTAEEFRTLVTLGRKPLRLLERYGRSALEASVHHPEHRDELIQLHRIIERTRGPSAKGIADVEQVIAEHLADRQRVRG